MSIKKIVFHTILLLFTCSVLCLSLLGCENYDAIVFDFYQDTRDGRYNAIELDFGENNSGIYFMDEDYGIWSIGEEKYLFDFDYVPRTQNGGQLMINIATEQSYYKSIVEQNNGLASFYNGKMVFSGSCEFSNNETIATISPDNIYVYEMPVDSNHTVVMTKTSLSEEDIVAFDVALNDMNFVSDTYFEFLSGKDSSQYSCELANLWVDGLTMTGEWSSTGSTVPIRMTIHEKVPYVEIFDISDSTEKLILKAYANVVDGSKIELVAPESEIFYATPSTPVIVTKTN